MTRRNWILLLTSLLMLALVGCGTKTDESSTSKESGSAPAPTPIDPATVGGITGSVSFEGPKPAPQRNGGHGAIGPLTVAEDRLAGQDVLSAERENVTGSFRDRFVCGGSLGPRTLCFGKDD